MDIALKFLFRFLEVLFFVGIAGSVIVLVITTVEDLAVLFEKDAPAPGTTAGVMTQTSASQAD
jgi:hypothetical protein